MSSSRSLKIRLGTRGSKLAMWQSNWVKQQLEQFGHQVELIQIRTQGDVKSGPLAQIGGQGLFTKQLQIALLEEQIDLAVHSLKDLPTEDHGDLVIAAVPERETTEDAVCCPAGQRLESISALAAGSRVGTGSVRRAAQIRHLRQDLEIVDIRGNVDTRLEKLDGGEYDAIVLAAAGLSRLGLQDRISFRFDSNQLLPAVGQGALGLEIRKSDEAMQSAMRELDHPASFAAALAERSMLRRLFAGCLAPVGALSHCDTENLTLTGVVLSRDGRERIEATLSAGLSEFESLGVGVAEQLLANGAEKLLTEAKAQT